uniref:TNF alpha induced protein 8 like 3 n=1 Tax=Sus scrofa TaxID=9823 RepID=A0A4X1SWX9_PIG
TLPLLPARASPPSSPRSPSAPHPQPRARLARRHRPGSAGSRARAALVSAEPPPGRGRRALPGPSETRQPEQDAGPSAPRTGSCGLPAGSPQHGFGFGRAERGRARDRCRPQPTPSYHSLRDQIRKQEGRGWYPPGAWPLIGCEGWRVRNRTGPVSLAGAGAGPDVFSSKSLALQAQKKILSKIASKTVANMLIDDTSSEIFDELYKVTKEHTHSKKEAHKIMKDLIKVAIKIGILYRNNQFSQEEVIIVEKFRKKLNQTAMTIVSFYEVEYTFDRNVLSKLLHECKDLVHELVQRHLTPRSHGRINHVFNHFADMEFLSTLYSLDGDCRPNLKKICEGINKLLDEKVL